MWEYYSGNKYESDAQFTTVFEEACRYNLLLTALSLHLVKNYYEKCE